MGAEDAAGRRAEENDWLVSHDSTQRLSSADAELLILDFGFSILDSRGLQLMSGNPKSKIQNPKFEHQRHKPPTPLERQREIVVCCAPMRSNVNLSNIVRTAG